MKTFWTILAVAGCGVVLLAQTNSPSNPKPERGATHIYSTSMEFEYQSLTLLYRGKVKVDDPQMQLTCELLTARFQTNNGKPEISGIIAETNVVIDAVDWQGRTNHATADKLVYSYTVVEGTTNQTLELTGNPRLTNSALQGGLSGALIIVDLVKGKMRAYDQITSFSTDATKSIAEELEGKKKQPNNQTTPEKPK